MFVHFAMGCVGAKNSEPEEQAENGSTEPGANSPARKKGGKQRVKILLLGLAFLSLLFLSCSS